MFGVNLIEIRSVVWSLGLGYGNRYFPEAFLSSNYPKTDITTKTRNRFCTFLNSLKGSTPKERERERVDFLNIPPDHYVDFRAFVPSTTLTSAIGNLHSLLLT